MSKKLTISYFFIIIAIGILFGLVNIKIPMDYNYFSAKAAFNHVEVIAKKPRPVGSEENTKAREYIIESIKKIGIQPEIQQKKYVIDNETLKINNIIARKDGLNHSKAILVMAHYDSVPTGPGAGDDASNVGVLLEVMEKIKNKNFENDVVFLFTDGEEAGLLGSKAFVEAFKLDNIGLVINLEARGHKGKSVLFETSTNNSVLIKEVIKALRYPVISSFLSELYKAMPNDTDYSPFRDNGVQGLNFAYLGGAYVYHTSEDKLDNLSLDSINHQGVNTIDLLNHFGNLDFKRLKSKSDNEVYFNLLGYETLNFSTKFNNGFVTLASILLIATVSIYYKRKAFEFKSLFKISVLYLLGLFLLFGFNLVYNLLIYFVVIQLNITAGLQYFSIVSAVIYLIFVWIGFVMVKKVKGLSKIVEMIKGSKNYDFVLSVILLNYVFVLLTYIKFPGLNYLFSINIICGLSLLILNRVMIKRRLRTKFLISICIVLMNLVSLLPAIYGIMKFMELSMCLILLTIAAICVIPINMPIFYYDKRIGKK